MVRTQVGSMVEDFANRLAQQGLGFEQYLQFTGNSMEQLQEQMRPEAMKRIQASLVLEAVAAKEDIQISDEDVEAEIDKMAGMYHMDVAELKEIMGDAERENIKRDLSIQKAVRLIMDSTEVIKAE